MRIISFSQRWPKLKQPHFTTFRYPRVDKDWYEGEPVQVFFKNRTPQRAKLGIAIIVGKEGIELEPGFEKEGRRTITDAEAIEDGFNSRLDMVAYMKKQYGLDYIGCMNKLTLEYLKGETK